jgi:predicted transcriptional regulator
MQKENVKKIIDRMPEDSTLEDIQYTLYVQSKIQKGLEAAENGDTLTQEEVEKRMEKWLKQ